MNIFNAKRFFLRWLILLVIPYIYLYTRVSASVEELSLPLIFGTALGIFIPLTLVVTYINKWIFEHRYKRNPTAVTQNSNSHPWYKEAGWRGYFIFTIVSYLALIIYEILRGYIFFSNSWEIGLSFHVFVLNAWPLINLAGYLFVAKKSKNGFKRILIFIFSVIPLAVYIPIYAILNVPVSFSPITILNPIIVMIAVYLVLRD